MIIQPIRVLFKLSAYENINGRRLTPIPLNQNIILYSPITFYNVTVSSLSTQNLTSGISIPQWVHQALQHVSQNLQEVTGNWVIHNARFTSLYGNGLINNAGIPSLLNHASSENQQLQSVAQNLNDTYQQSCASFQKHKRISNSASTYLRGFDMDFKISHNLPINSVYTFDMGLHKYLLLNSGCISFMYQWNATASTFQNTGSSHTGIVNSWIHIFDGPQSQFQIYFVTNSNDDNFSCTIYGLNIWRYDQLNNALVQSGSIGSANYFSSIQKRPNSTTFYAIRKNDSVVIEYHLNGVAIEQWKVPTALAFPRFMPPEANLGLAVTNGKTLSILSSTKAKENLVTLGTVDFDAASDGSGRSKRCDEQFTNIPLGNGKFWNSQRRCKCRKRIAEFVQKSMPNLYRAFTVGRAKQGADNGKNVENSAVGGVRRDETVNSGPRLPNIQSSVAQNHNKDGIPGKSSDYHPVSSNGNETAEKESETNGISNLVARFNEKQVQNISKSQQENPIVGVGTNDLGRIVVDIIDAIEDVINGDFDSREDNDDFFLGSIHNSTSNKSLSNARDVFGAIEAKLIPITDKIVDRIITHLWKDKSKNHKQQSSANKENKPIHEFGETKMDIRLAQGIMDRVSATLPAKLNSTLFGDESCDKFSHGNHSSASDPKVGDAFGEFESHATMLSDIIAELIIDEIERRNEPDDDEQTDDPVVGDAFGNIQAFATDMSDNMVEILILGFQDQRDEEEAEDFDDILSSSGPGTNQTQDTKNRTLSIYQKTLKRLTRQMNKVIEYARSAGTMIKHIQQIKRNITDDKKLDSFDENVAKQPSVEETVGVPISPRVITTENSFLPAMGSSEIAVLKVGVGKKMLYAVSHRINNVIKGDHDNIVVSRLVF